MPTCTLAHLQRVALDVDQQLARCAERSVRSSRRSATAASHHEPQPSATRPSCTTTAQTAARTRISKPRRKKKLYCAEPWVKGRRKGLRSRQCACLRSHLSKPRRSTFVNIAHVAATPASVSPTSVCPQLWVQQDLEVCIPVAVHLRICVSARGKLGEL
jgi:hypothetical protein